MTDTIIERSGLDSKQFASRTASLGSREWHVKGLALMDALVRVLKRRTVGREISGLSAYELLSGRRQRRLT